MSRERLEGLAAIVAFVNAHGGTVGDTTLPRYESGVTYGGPVRIALADGAVLVVEMDVDVSSGCPTCGPEAEATVLFWGEAAP